MRGRHRMTGIRLGLTYGACLALLGLTIAAVSAQPSPQKDVQSASR